ncbi:acyltransferase family protein [Spongisporangium articulatum]|uniref:Acyltransferase family protein n=1 Tax=Spongisporangium articulatum TaxID=3362603 RepID=A0ABW8ARU2_9ACTN
MHAAPGTTPSTPSTLSSRFEAARSTLVGLRLTLAVLVCFAHAAVLGFGGSFELLGRDVGGLAVDGFFVLSGFLLCRSLSRNPGLGRYAWHRALRILPGFWVCLALTALVVAPLLAVLRGRSATSVFTGDDSSWAYLVRNAGLLIRQWGVTALPVDVPYPGVLNGSLWTLFYEAGCYLVLGVVAFLGRRRRWPLLAGLALAWTVTALPLVGVAVGHDQAAALLLMFLLGACGHRFGDRIPVRPALVLFAVLLALGGLALTSDYRPVAGPALAYLVLAAATLRRAGPRGSTGDLSYGVYVYHWPVFQVLAVAGLSGAGALVFVVAGVGVTAALAWLSWHYVEAPALRLRDVSFRRPARVSAARHRAAAPARLPVPRAPGETYVPAPARR